LCFYYYYYYYYYALLHLSSEGVARQNTAPPLAISVAWCGSFVFCSVRALVETTPSGGEGRDAVFSPMFSFSPDADT
jgi:hypothetical protein